MKNLLQTLLAGVLVIAPFAVTAYVVYWLGSWLGEMGANILQVVRPDMFKPEPGKPVDPLFKLAGAVLLLGIVYVVGLLTRLWAFRKFLSWIDRIVTRLPGVKSLYESVRNLLKLFSGDAQKMGRVVQYCAPGSGLTMLGILTNQNPTGVRTGPKKVAVYLPLSYMLGGPTVYVSPDELTEVDMPVEQLLKIAATADISMEEPPSSP